jgi:hypothetical protein
MFGAAIFPNKLLDQIVHVDGVRLSPGCGTTICQIHQTHPSTHIALVYLYDAGEGLYHG